MYPNSKRVASQLGSMLQPYKNENPVVLGIWQGGVGIGFYIARQLAADYAPLIVQKLVYPLGRKFAFGAVAEDGSLFHHATAAKGISQEMKDIQEEMAIETMEQRKKLLRQHFPLPDLEGRTVIIADDDIATGSTMMAAIVMCRQLGAARIIVTIPTAPRSKIALLRHHADNVVILPAVYVAQIVPGAFNTQARTDEAMIRMLQKLTNQQQLVTAGQKRNTTADKHAGLRPTSPKKHAVTNKPDSVNIRRLHK